LNKLFKPSYSNPMNMMQPHIQQQQQQGPSPSPNSNTTTSCFLMVKGKNNKNNVVSRACVYIYIYKKTGRVSARFTQVDRVSPAQLPGEFLLRPGPVPGPGRPAKLVRVSKLFYRGLWPWPYTCGQQ